MTNQTYKESRWAGLREITVMTGPILLGAFSFTVMQFVDQVMVSWLGSDALAAVGPAGLWVYILSTLSIGLAGCISTFVSQSLGRGEKDKCAAYAWQGLYISVISGVAVLALWPFATPAFETMGHTPEVVVFEAQYFRIRLLGYMFMAALTALTAFFQAIRKPRIPMYAAFVGNALNIILDYLLIFGKFGFPRWEVGGAAAATVIALGVQTLVLIAVFLDGKTDATYKTRTAYAIDFKRLRELFRIGAPSSITLFMEAANWGFFTSIIIGTWFGTAQLAAHNVAINFIHLSFMPALALNQGITAIAGRWIGRNDIPRAKARTYTAMKIAVVYMTAMGVVFAVFGEPLIRICFSTDPDIVDIGSKLLILAAIFQAFDAINIVAIGALRGVGDTLWMAIMAACGGYFLFLPMALIFAWYLGWGAFGAWTAATLYIIIISGVLFMRFHGERWRHVKIFQEDFDNDKT